MEKEQDRLRLKNLEERQAIIKLLKEKEAQARELLASEVSEETLTQAQQSFKNCKYSWTKILQKIDITKNIRAKWTKSNSIAYLG